MLKISLTMCDMHGYRTGYGDIMAASQLAPLGSDKAKGTAPTV